MSDTLRISAAFDRTAIRAKGGSYRYLVAEVTAPERDRDPEAVRSPLNLALVIDRSGSMAGRPLEAAKEAAAGVVRTLRPEDHLTVVAFDSDVQMVLPPTSMHHDGKTEALERLRGIDPRGCTNLAGGWLAAAEAVSGVSAQAPDARHRIVLLTDGMANAGVTDASHLAEMARELRNAGIYTSAVGIGDHYSTTQIQVLAEHGGGRLHDAQHPHEIVEVVSAELEDLLHTTAEDVEVIVESPDGVRVRCLSAFGSVERDGFHVASLGQMLSATRRQVVFEVACPAGELGGTLHFTVRASWKDPERGEGGKRRRTRPVKLALDFVRGRDLKDLRPDPDVGLAVAKAWQSSLMLRIAGLNADGAFHRIRELAETEGRYFLAYCRMIEGAEWLTLDLHFLFEHADRPVSPRAQKEVWLMSAKSSRAEADKRSMMRPDWKDLFRE